MADFFPKKEEKKEEKTDNQEPAKIKVGEDEYSQEELTELVGLGKIGQEAEEKYDTKIDKVWPNLQKTINEKKELEEKLKDLEEKKEETVSTQAQDKVAKGQQLSVEEQSKLVVEELKKHNVMFKEDFDPEYQQRRTGERILSKTNRVIKENTKAGKPAVEPEKLLEFMKDPNNPADPEVAYKVMFESEIDQWKADKLAGSKPKGMVTEAASKAGGKKPELKRPQTFDELGKALSAHLEGT